jgi:NAD kinase
MTDSYWGIKLAEQVGIIVKPDSSRAESIALRVVNVLEERGIEPVIEETSRDKYSSLRDYKSFSLDNPPDKVIVIGGDGTLLRTIMFLGRQDTIVMAIRAGKRGFLLDVEPYEVEDRVVDFLEGTYKIIEYERLEVKPPQHARACVMNDAVFIANKSKFNDPRWFWLLLSKPSKSLIVVAFTFGSWYSFFPISSNALGSSVPAEKIPLGL